MFLNVVKKTLVPALLACIACAPLSYVCAEDQVPKPSLPTETPKKEDTPKKDPAPSSTPKVSGNGKAQLDEGRTAYNEKHYGLAEQKLRAAVDASTGNDTGIEGEARLYLGMTLVQQGKYQEGADLIQKARDLKLSPKQDAEASAALTYVNLYGGVTVAKRGTANLATKGGPSKKWFVNLTAAQDYTTGLAVPNGFSNVTFDANTQTFSNGNFDVKRDEDFRSWAFVNGGYRFDVSSKDVVTVEDSFYQSIYAGFDEYNLQMHQPKVTYQHTVNQKLFFKAAYDFQYLLLGSGFDPYQWSHRGSGDVYFSEASKFWLQGHYEIQHQNFRDSNQEQDSLTQTVGINQFVLLPNWKKFLQFSYSHSESNAHSDRWSFGSDKVGLSGLYYFTKKDAWYAAASYEDIRYDGKDIIHQDRARHDKSTIFQARYSHDFTSKVTLWGQYKFQDNNSNIRRQDFESHTASIGVSVKF